MSGGSAIAVAVAASIATILSGPFVDVLRAAVRRAFPDRFAAVVTIVVGVTLAIICLAALSRIRGHWRVRVPLLAAAVALGVSYAGAVSTGQPEVDAVERVHFIEYGVIGWLFYRVWRPRQDWSIAVLPLLAGLLVGTLDELLQWYVPGRVGEIHDVFINGVAVACGLLFGLGLEPPALPLARGRAGSRRRALIGGAAASGVFAVFLNAVHLGHVVSDGSGGSFVSRYSAVELASASRDRAERWRTQPPAPPSRLSREDHYLSEARFHLQARNQAWGLGQTQVAWAENRILETFYAPVLDTPFDFSPTPARWPAEQRRQAQAVAVGTGSSVSAAYPYPLFVWPRPLFWLVAVAAIAGLAAGAWHGRRRSRGDGIVGRRS